MRWGEVGSVVEKLVDDSPDGAHDIRPIDCRVFCVNNESYC